MKKIRKYYKSTYDIFAQRYFNRNNCFWFSLEDSCTPFKRVPCDSFVRDLIFFSNEISEDGLRIIYRR